MLPAKSCLFHACSLPPPPTQPWLFASNFVLDCSYSLLLQISQHLNGLIHCLCCGSYPGRADWLTCVPVAESSMGLAGWLLLKTKASWKLMGQSFPLALSSVVNGLFWSIGFQTSLSRAALCNLWNQNCSAGSWGWQKELCTI